VELPYQQYFDALPCYVTVQNHDFSVLTANARFVKDFGDYRGRYCYQSTSSGRRSASPC
jgi:hypothetical protein